MSVADATVEIIHIRNLLNELLTGTSMVSSGPRVMGSGDESVGYNDDVIDCAIELSKNYCKEFGRIAAEKMDGG